MRISCFWGFAFESRKQRISTRRQSKKADFKKTGSILCLALLMISFVTGCSDTAGQGVTLENSSGEVVNEEETPLRDNTPEVLVSEAPGTVIYTGDTFSVDVSNANKGYITLQYTGTNPKVQVRLGAIDKPTQGESVEYYYLLTDYNKMVTYPLSEGDGAYEVTLLESVDVDNDKYACILNEPVEVTLENEFTPFLYPNAYVNFTADSEVVKKAQELASEAHSDLDVVGEVYNYVVNNVVYDEDKVDQVTYGYAPNVDETFETNKGICFDYASLMTAMLRSQRIPTKLEVGYAGEVYHAWISCYVDEIGWVDNIIEFDGVNWKMMDPTFAASSSKGTKKDYIGDGTNYHIKFNY